jgi:hypothetical protein
MGGLVVFILAFMQGEVVKEVSVISKGTGSSTFLDGAEGSKEGFWSNGKGRLAMLLCLRVCLVLSRTGGRGMGWVCAGEKSINDVLDGRRVKGGIGLVLVEDVKGTLLFIKVSKALSFGGIAGRDLEVIESRIMCG